MKEGTRNTHLNGTGTYGLFLKLFGCVGFLFTSALIPLVAFAHEVYVLSPQEIATGLSTTPISPITIIEKNIGEFALWTLIALLVVFVVFFVSISRKLEKKFDLFLTRIKKYAPAASRITIGLSFLAAAYFQASYGPELPLSATFGAYTSIVTVILIVIGVLIIIGFWTRAAALVALGLYLIAVYYHGWYMLTYTNYLGEIIVLLLIGSHHFGVEGFLKTPIPPRHVLDTIVGKLAPYSFMILRVCFGISLLYASLYAKFIHANLAFEVVEKYGLTQFFHFEPHFVVLGAGIVEIVIGLFFLLGIEIRFTAIFLEFWLTLSLLYFGEVVWPHLILIGIPIAFVLYGYDKYSLEGMFFKREDREPVF
jgi:uncharacterized membrane protein YphA (DoxX/SURF4 family)